MPMNNPPLVLLPNEIVGLTGDATVCRYCEYFDFTINKRETLSRMDTILFDSMVEAWDTDPFELYSNSPSRPVSLDDSIYLDICDAHDYYVRAIGRVVSNFSFVEVVDNTVILPFEKLNPTVYSPPRILTELLSPMESMNLNISSYENMRSPILYKMNSPYIHIGTKINRTIYPLSTISIKGKKTRYGY
jgi:hypothetical protein